MTLLQDKNRDYRRWDHSGYERFELAKHGFQAVQSSNVSAVGQSEGDLMIRFHNGSVYRYFKMGDELMSILSSNSKGKWVWRYLRRAGVPYQLVGVLELPDDLDVTDQELFAMEDERYYEDMTEYVGGIKRIVKTQYGEMEYMQVMGREIFRLLP